MATLGSQSWWPTTKIPFLRAYILRNRNANTVASNLGLAIGVGHILAWLAGSLGARVLQQLRPPTEDSKIDIFRYSLCVVGKQ